MKKKFCYSRGLTKSFLILFITFFLLSFSNSIWAGWLGSDVRITRGLGMSSTSFNFSRNIAVDNSGNIFVVWTDSKEGFERVYYDVSQDNGLFWETNGNFQFGSPNSGLPCIATNGTYVYVFYQVFNGSENDIAYRIYDGQPGSGGSPGTFSPEQILTSGPVANQHSCSVAAYGNHVHVVWTDNRNNGVEEVYAAHSDNNGVSFSTPKLVSTNDGFNSYTPTVAMADNAGTGDLLVTVLWTDARHSVLGPNAGEEEYLAVYLHPEILNPGFAPENVRLTDDPASSWAPSALLTGTGAETALHLTWFDFRDDSVSPEDNAEIFYKRISNNVPLGIRISDLDSPTPIDSRRPSIVNVGNHLYIFWHDNKHNNNPECIVPNSLGNSEIYYSMSTDLGENWTAPTRLTRFSGASWRPHVAVGPGAGPPGPNNYSLNVIWMDNRDDVTNDGNWEIYFQRFTP